MKMIFKYLCIKVTLVNAYKIIDMLSESHQELLELKGIKDKTPMTF